MVSRTLQGAEVNKLIFALFTMGGASLPFLLYRLRPESISFTVVVSLSVVLVLGYLVLYCVQVLPSFVTSGSFGPLAQLPLAAEETSVVAAMTLWRTLDYILVLSITTQVLVVAYFTGSDWATLIVLATSVSSSVLAIGLALWFTSLFQKRVEGGSFAGLRAFFKPLVFVLWGLGVMSVVFLFSLISYVAPPLNAVLADPTNVAGLVFSLLYPFSTGLLVSHLAGIYVAGTTLVLASIGVVAAVAGAAIASVGMSRLINGVVLPLRNATASASSRSFAFKIRRPLSGYLVKDLRVSSRSPATGFLFALPLFEILAVVIPITSTAVVRMSALLVGVQVGGGFALFTAFLLVTVDDFGVERKTGLPFSERVRTLSKVIVPTVTYVPVTIALTAVLLDKPSTFAGATVIPFSSLCSVFAACVVEVMVLRLLGQRNSGNAARFISGTGSGEVVMLVPSLAYTLCYLLTRSHWASIELLASTSLLELLAATLTISLLGRRGTRAIG